jgi:hypothetical protein
MHRDVPTGPCTGPSLCLEVEGWRLQQRFEGKYGRAVALYQTHGEVS